MLWQQNAYTFFQIIAQFRAFGGRQLIDRRFDACMFIIAAPSCLDTFYIKVRRWADR
ncbi:MAG: hypothetical protein SF123_16740 [Chloroflexota bacterium]|nr:hypothetical protein [Chloroflexota bacterium]